MNKGLIFAIGTAIGAAAGSAVTYVIQRRKAREEVEDVRRYYKDKAEGKVPVWEKKATQPTATTEAKPKTGEGQSNQNNKFYEKSTIDGSLDYQPKKAYSETYKPEYSSNAFAESPIEKINADDINAAKKRHAEDMKVFNDGLSVITYDEFRKYEDDDKYTVYRYTYYEQDDLVIDEDADPAGFIVDEQITGFGGIEEVKYHPDYPNGDTAFYLNEGRYAIYSLTVISDYEWGREYYTTGKNRMHYPTWCNELQNGSVSYDDYIEMYGLDDCRLFDPRR